MALNKIARCMGLLGISLIASSVSHAALQGRDLDGNAGNGYEAYYDTVQNLTWMADANYAKTAGLSGANADGTMSIGQATAAGVPLDHFGVVGWRLPTAERSAPSTVSGTRLGYDGSTFRGYNIKDPRSEMSYMYYVNLGLPGKYDTAGVERAGFTPLASGDVAIPGLEGGIIRNLQAFDGTQSAIYWTQTPNGTLPNWWFDFEFDKGAQELFRNSESIRPPYTTAFVWFVHDGDVVASIPEPANAGLMLLGLVGLGLAARHHRAKG